MKYLLDTHSLLWALFAPEKLSADARKEIVNPENDISVSVIAFWEISFKYALGKLEFVGINPEDLPAAVEQIGLDVLHLDQEDAASFYQLPRLAHKDPFDRLIIWQAIRNKRTLISADSSFKDYAKHGLTIHW